MNEKLEILYDVGKTAFEIQIANYRAIDTKSSILLALFGLILLESLSNICQNDITYYPLILSTILSFVGIILSLCIMRVHKLKIPFDKLDEFQNLYESNVKSDDMVAQVFANLKGTTEFNKSIIDSKVIYLKRAYYLLIGAVVIFSISILIKKLI